MAARIAVGLVLLAAGGAKLGQAGWPATAKAFGAPAWLAPALPWGELVLGALLVAGIGTPWTALAAATTLSGFTVAVGLRVRRGDAVPCGCFGETSSEPVGLDTVVRNAVLVVLAVLAAVGGGRRGGSGSLILGVAGGLALVVGSRARTGARRARRG